MLLRFIAFLLFWLGLLQGGVSASGLNGLSLTGYRRDAGCGVSVLLLVVGIVLLLLTPLLPIVLVAIPALLLALLVMGVVSLFVRVEMVPPVAGNPGKDDPWTAEPISFLDEAGMATGFLLKSHHASANAATVCWVHGVGDDKENYKWVLARALTQRGFNVLTFTLPGHGDRVAEPFTVPDGLSAVPAALDFLRQRADVNPDRIGLMGVSLGGALSIRALAAGQRVATLALLEVPCSLHFTDRLWWKEAFRTVSVPSLNIFRDCSPGGLRRTWNPRSNFADTLDEVFAELRPEEYMAQVPSLPLLIVNGGRDPIAPVEHGRRLFARASEPKVHQIVRPASHVSLIFMHKTANLVADWFANHL